MQFVMIRPTKTESCFEISKKNACRIWSVTITNDGGSDLTWNGEALGDHFGWSVARVGDIIVLAGIEDVKIGDTICNREHPKALPRISVDEPTVSMQFTINNSPFGGMEGKYVQSSRLRERLHKETLLNVAIQVEAGQVGDDDVEKPLVLVEKGERILFPIEGKTHQLFIGGLLKAHGPVMIQGSDVGRPCLQKPTDPAGSPRCLGPSTG